MKTISREDYILCICEGKSEKAIINILLDTDKILFYRDQLIQNKIFHRSKYRNVKVIEKEILQMSYAQKIHLIYVGDKINPYHFGALYKNKISSIHYLVTRPELEILMIHNEEKVNDYNKVKSSKKPSIFLAEYLKLPVSVIKSTDYIQNYFNEKSLICCLEAYKSKSKHQKEEKYLADLMK